MIDPSRRIIVARLEPRAKRRYVNTYIHSTYMDNGTGLAYRKRRIAGAALERGALLITLAHVLCLVCCSVKAN